MRTRRRVAFIVASAAALGVGLIATASAGAEPVVPACVPVPSAGNDSCVRVVSAPANAGPAFGPASVGVRTGTVYTAPGNKPQGGFASTVVIRFDNDFNVNTAAVPGNCAVADVANKTVQQAYAACGPGAANPAKRSYLSPTNTITGRASTAPASNFGGCVLAFKGPTASQIILFTRVTTVVNSNPNCTTPAAASAGNVSITLVGTIAANGAAPPGYGKKLTVPGISNLTLPLDNFYATINKGNYFQSRCSAGVSPWKIQGVFTYSGNGGGGPDVVGSSQACS